ncbi:hypothetical protein IU485_27820 [Nocardia cyriacigeorgica]|uniref:hypothetical protein n=1 Tax=Nocardia cyriacigeorgica TaxID=135487 RepID=UPI00189493F2|nr:hypothetical protein [Nocardia cyriacigeorgica]MBF6085186.1 hypothetical protein [Nocardia cyriacigeorgica]
MTFPHVILQRKLVQDAMQAVDDRLATLEKHGATSKKSRKELYAMASVWVLTALSSATAGREWNEEEWTDEAEGILEQFDVTNYTEEIWPAKETADDLG